MHAGTLGNTSRDLLRREGIGSRPALRDIVAAAIRTADVSLFVVDGRAVDVTLFVVDQRQNVGEHLLATSAKELVVGHRHRPLGTLLRKILGFAWELFNRLLFQIPELTQNSDPARTICGIGGKFLSPR